MGDLNQDGHEDIIVGVPHSSLSDIGGAVAMLYLDENEQILDVILIDGDTPNMQPLIELVNRDDVGERFGHSVANLAPHFVTLSEIRLVEHMCYFWDQMVLAY